MQAILTEPRGSAVTAVLRNAARGLGAAVGRVLTRVADSYPQDEEQIRVLLRFPFF